MSITEPLLDYSDQEKFHPPESSTQWENDNEKAVWLLTSTVGAKLDEGAKKTKSSFSSACVYRVPKELRQLKESAYTPRLIAIGPLHRNDPHLQTPMQQYVKICNANHLLCRLTKGMKEDQELAERKKFALLQECLAAMKASMDDAKKCYAEEVTVDEEMMLVDGCFILEVLYRYYLRYRKKEGKRRITGKDNGNSEGEAPPVTDPILDNKFTFCTVQHDLLLLENQIPFLVLEKLFNLTVARVQMNFSLTDSVFLFFHDVMSPVNSKPEEEVPSGIAKCYDRLYHMLHRIHDGYLPYGRTEKKAFTELMPSASQLVYAGVKIVPGTGVTGHDLLKVKFTEPEGLFWWWHRARFEIPSLRIYDLTESFLRNLIAFEQNCYPGISQHFTSYAYLMDMLVNSDKDVQVLERAGVVRNYLGVSEDATHLFNKLLKEVAIGEFFFADPCDRAAKYSKRFWPKNIAYVRHTYFASPWKFIALCLGFITFGMSFTVFVRSYVRK